MNHAKIEPILSVMGILQEESWLETWFLRIIGFHKAPNI